MKTYQYRMGEAGAPLSLVALVGADCTCWPDIEFRNLGNVIQASVGHHPECARLRRLKEEGNQS